MADSVTNVSPSGVSATVADIDAFLASVETRASRIQAEVDLLSEVRVRVAVVDRMHTALAGLRAAVAGPAGGPWRALQQLREATALARFDGYSPDIQGLLLLETRCTQGMGGALLRGQRYLQALRHLDGTGLGLDTLVTTYLQIDRNPEHWPADRAADAGCRQVAESLEDAAAALAAGGAGLARLLVAYRRLLAVQLPDRSAPPGTEGDDAAWRKLLTTALEPGDTMGALASIMLARAITKLGLLDRPAYFLADALRLTPPPPSAGDAAELAWLAAAIADGAEQAASRARACRLQLEVLERRLGAIGGRDRKRSELFALLVRNPIVTAGHLAELAGVSNRAALSFCDLMVEHGIARHIGRGSGHRMVSVDPLVSL